MTMTSLMIIYHASVNHGSSRQVRVKGVRWAGSRVRQGRKHQETESSNPYYIRLALGLRDFQFG
jgi:hypothetical protein